MAIHFDFESTDVFVGAASGIAAGGTFATLCTIPMGSASFPLQSGRVARVEAEFVGFDSNGLGLGSTLVAVIDSTIPASTAVGSASAFGISGNNSQPSGVSGPSFFVNASGDLDVQWENGNVSGASQDMAVRVCVRWVGA